MADDDQKQMNTTQDDGNVIASEQSEAKQSQSEEDLPAGKAGIATSSASQTPRNDENLPVEEAGQIEAPKESQEVTEEPEVTKEPEVEKIETTEASQPEEDNSSVIASEQSERGNLDSNTNQDSDVANAPQNDNTKTDDSTPAATETPDEALPHEDETERDKPAPAPEPVKDDSPGRWYVVHTYSGHENKVAATLKQRIESEHLESKILDVLVPMQDKIEIKGGKRLEVKEKIFPGYILVKMILDDNTWLAVRTTQGVTSFVGIGNKPTPIPESEVQTIVKFTQIQHPTFKQIFAVDDTIKIVDGPFSDFIGKIESVDEEKGKVRVLVSIFGRETPVELDFLQVQKI